MSTTSYLVQTGLSVFVVLALGALAALLLRRLQSPAQRGPLERIASLPLDARRAIHLVRIGEQVLIVGASEGGLQKLGEMPRDAVPLLEPRRTASASFSAVLAQLRGTRP